LRQLALIVSTVLLWGGVAEAKKRPRRAARMGEIRKKTPVAGELRSPAFNNAPRGETDLERNLQAALDAVVSGAHLRGAVNGLYVVDVKSGRVLYAYGAERQLNPASNTKLVSTATALDVLGPDFTYDTRILGAAPNQEGVVEGNVYLVGGGDPTLRTRGLEDLAAKLAAAGVRRVTGDVIIGEAARDAVTRAAIAVTVKGTLDGDLAEVEISPDSGYFVLDTTAVTTEQKGKLDVSLAVEDGSVVVTVAGKISPGQVVEAVREVPGLAMYTAHAFRAAALRAGIAMEGGVRQEGGVLPAELTALAVHHSVPLSQLAALINKPSNNFLADRLIATVGGERFGGGPSLQKGVQAMADWLKRVGITPGSYRLENGSGLSHAIHISPRQVVTVLMAGAAALGGAWLNSLSVGGQDGTLKYRFAGRPSAGHIKGKTGTLSGVATLSGFVTVGDEEVCFSFLSNGFRKKRKNGVREGQADAVDAMYRYLVARGGKPTATVPPPAAAPPAEAPADPADSATDMEEEEPQSTEGE